MDTIFMNSEDNKTSKPHVLIFNHIYKIDLRRGKKKHFFIKAFLYHVGKHEKFIQ